MVAFDWWFHRDFLLTSWGWYQYHTGKWVPWFSRQTALWIPQTGCLRPAFHVGNIASISVCISTCEKVHFYVSGITSAEFPPKKYITANLQWDSRAATSRSSTLKSCSSSDFSVHEGTPTYDIIHMEAGTHSCTRVTFSAYQNKGQYCTHGQGKWALGLVVSLSSSVRQSHYPCQWCLYELLGKLKWVSSIPI